jgi:hypothetical protein
MTLGRFHSNERISYAPLPAGKEDTDSDYNKGGKKDTDRDYNKQTSLDKFSSGGCKRGQGTVVLRRLQIHYRRITFTKSLSFCITNFSWSLTNLTVLLPRSHDYNFIAHRPIMTLSLHRKQQHADLRPHDFTQSPGLWHQPTLVKITCTWSWRLSGINPAISSYHKPCYCSLAQ